MVEDEEYDALLQKYRALEAKVLRHEHEIEQIAGQALGYPWYCDDPKNFPGAVEGHGVCIGEHVSNSIVRELADKYKRLEIENRILWLVLEQIGSNKEGNDNAIRSDTER